MTPEIPKWIIYTWLVGLIPAAMIFSACIYYPENTKATWKISPDWPYCWLAAIVWPLLLSCLILALCLRYCFAPIFITPIWLGCKIVKFFSPKEHQNDR